MNAAAEQTIRNALSLAGLSPKAIEVYGSQAVITCISAATARKVAHILGLGSFRLRGIVCSQDPLTDSGVDARCKAGTVRLHNCQRVYRAFFRV